MRKKPFWHLPIDQIYQQVKGHKEGLSSADALIRLKNYGPNTLKPPRKGKGITLFLSQFKSPLTLLLIGAAILSFFLSDSTDSIIIFSIVILSGLLSFFQERGALNTLEKLLQIVENKTTVLRDGKEVKISIDHIVPGDVIILRAGDLVPADSVLLEANHCFVDEATLTGESFPVQKTPSGNSLETTKADRENALFLGTMISSGTAKALVVVTGKNTAYGAIAERVRFRPPETAFEVGVRRFGFFLLELTLILVITIFAFNIYFHKPIIESFLFSLAIAVGLTPQLLPAIISVNLAHGARRMAKKHVVIKRLASIENFGQMNILCADKTGTLTLADIKLDSVVGVDGKENPKVALYGFLNAHFQSGYNNPLDKAILQKEKIDISSWEKVSEIPYDFIRKRLSIVCKNKDSHVIISKGAFPEVLSVCNQVELPDGKTAPLTSYKDEIESYYEKQCEKGFRTLAVAYGEGNQEKNLTFLGFLHFSDPIKPGIAHTVSDLKKKGVNLKIITGDHHSVALFVASQIGVSRASVITGAQLSHTSDHALIKIVEEKNVFAEIEPNQKERIIMALRKAGNIVGFIGDGVNDVSALHSADVGIAVNNGADATKEIADIVLLKKDLGVLRDGIEEGRRTFVNTMKYVYMATSANFGNMFSMAGASLFLPFLPLLPKQVLLTNFFSDLPEMALATDNVDSETVGRPVKWDIPFIRRFMMVFGLLNSMADFLTFGVLLYFFHADETLFRSGWFVENVVSAALIVLAIRTPRLLFKSKPSLILTIAVFTVVIGIPFLPFTPFGNWFNLVPLPTTFYIALAAIVGIFIFSVEVAKYFFFRKRTNKKEIN
ncbi:MAG: magnesium-translocating P-type ATPase [Chlamydiae bacterium]|nr:magnesium-translocating P-type ATPase [Chlamydiota bacterium]